MVIVAVGLFLIVGGIAILLLTREEPWRAPEWGRDPETGEWS